MGNLREKLLAIGKASLPKGRFARAVALLVGGTALGQVVVAFASPILARLYTPEEFGVLAVYSSLVATVTVVSSFRYEQAIPLPKEEAAAINLLVVSLFALLIVAVATGLFLLFAADYFLVGLGMPGLRDYLWLVPLGVIGNGFYQVLNYWAVRRQDFTAIARTRVARDLAKVSIQVGGGLANLGVWGLLLGYLTGAFAGNALLARRGWRTDKHLLRGHVNWGAMVTVAKRYIRFPLFSTWAALFNVLGWQLPIVFLAAMYGPKAAGWFSLGHAVLAVPLNMVIESVAQVYLAEAARLVRENPKALKRLFLTILLRLSLVGALPLFAFSLVAPFVFPLVFGPAWERAGQYVQVLGAMYGVRLVVTPLAPTFSVLERQDMYFMQDLSRLMLIWGGFALAKVFSVSDLMAVALYAGAVTVSTAFFGLLLAKVLHAYGTKADR